MDKERSWIHVDCILGILQEAINFLDFPVEGDDVDKRVLRTH